MGRREAHLPSRFSLLNSEFNDFLHAPIAEEDGAGILTVLSAFSREGIDPWQQAAALGRLPKKMASRKLTSLIETLPDEYRWKSESRAIADRLVELLPPRPSFRTRLLSMTLRLRTMLP
jgi:hypothetical protein